jgi:hypothetical protein
MYFSVFKTNEEAKKEQLEMDVIVSIWSKSIQLSILFTSLDKDLNSKYPQINHYCSITQLITIDHQNDQQNFQNIQISRLG